MTRQHLNNLFLMYVHTERSESLDLTSVAKEFVPINSRRLNYFGKYSVLSAHICHPDELYVTIITILLSFIIIYSLLDS